MINDEGFPCQCPTCGSEVYFIETFDGYGNITPLFVPEVSWLDRTNAVCVEQGSDVPNTNGAGS